MRFDWDEAKRRSNADKHGIDFAEVERFDWQGAIYLEDDYAADERRCRALGFLDDRLVALVYTLRGETCRVISMRKATRHEYKVYGDE